MDLSIKWSADGCREGTEEEEEEWRRKEKNRPSSRRCDSIGRSSLNPKSSSRPPFYLAASSPAPMVRGDRTIESRRPSQHTIDSLFISSSFFYIYGGLLAAAVLLSSYLFIWLDSTARSWCAPSCLLTLPSSVASWFSSFSRFRNRYRIDDVSFFSTFCSPLSLFFYINRLSY